MSVGLQNAFIITGLSVTWILGIDKTTSRAPDHLFPSINAKLNVVREDAKLAWPDLKHVCLLLRVKECEGV